MPRAALRAPRIALSGAIGEKWYARPHRYAAGQTHAGHTHVTDHVTYLQYGKVTVDLSGPHGEEDHWEAEGPAFLDIRAGWHHTIHAVTDAFWYCIFYDSREADEAAPFHAER